MHQTQNCPGPPRHTQSNRNTCVNTATRHESVRWQGQEEPRRTDTGHPRVDTSVGGAGCTHEATRHAEHKTNRASTWQMPQCGNAATVRKAVVPCHHKRLLQSTQAQPATAWAKAHPSQYNIQDRTAQLAAKTHTYRCVVKIEGKLPHTHNCKSCVDTRLGRAFTTPKPQTPSLPKGCTTRSPQNWWGRLPHTQLPGCPHRPW